MTAFQAQVNAATCRFAPTEASPSTVTFYDRSLLGDWFFVARGPAAPTVQDVVGLELSFQLVATDR
jgi:hypothetical protein